MIRLSLALVLLCTPALADPLPQMAGSWSGSGTARQASDAPPEAVRCRLDNDWQAKFSRLRVRGRCAVPGRKFEIDGALIDKNGAISGFWRNPDGPGQVRVSGQTRDDAVYFSFSATDPDTGRDVSQLVTWHLDGSGLTFEARHRATDTPMAEIEFSR